MATHWVYGRLTSRPYSNRSYTSGSVRDAFRACDARAVGAAIKRVVRFDAVPDHLNITVLADRGECVDRTLEAVEGMRVPTGDHDGDRLGVPYTTHKRAHFHRRSRETMSRAPANTEARKSRRYPTTQNTYSENFVLTA